MLTNKSIHGIERLLVVGQGAAGTRHLELARELLPESRFGVISRHASPKKGVELFSTVEEALAFQPNAAIIANPASLHVDVALPLAEKGVHLLIEKPLSDRVSGVQQLVDSCAKNQCVLMLGYNLRFLASLRHFRQQICEEVLGPVWSVRAEVGQYLPTWRPQADYRHSVSARRDLGGGALLELSHEIDYLRWIFGEVEWVDCALDRSSALQIDVEDIAFLTLGFSRNADKRPLMAAVALDFLRHDAQRQCTALCEQGTLHWNAISGEVRAFRGEQSGWSTLFEEKPSRNASYRDELIHFFQCIERGTRPLATGEDGLQVLRIIESARLAAQHHLRVAAPSFQLAK